MLFCHTYPCMNSFLWVCICYEDREGNGTPLQYSCLENPMDGGAWWAAIHGVAKSRTWLSNFTFSFHFHALEKEMATHSSVLAWRIPGTGEPGGLPSMGSHRIGHDWSDLAQHTLWRKDSAMLVFIQQQHSLIHNPSKHMMNRTKSRLCQLDYYADPEGQPIVFQSNY